MSASKKTQEKIIRAAISCLKAGVAKTRAIDIARKAGIEHSHLLYHYKTVEDIHVAVIQYILEDLKTASIESIASNKANPQKALEEYILTPFRWAEEKPDYFSLWIYFYYLASFQKQFRKLNSEIRSIGRERIQNLVLRGLHEKSWTLPTGLSLEELATLIQDMITGAVITENTEDGDGRPNRKNALIRSIQVLLRP